MVNRGFDDLERRDDSPGYLIAKYKSIELSDTAEYEVFFVRYRLHLFEVLISQSSILEKMSVNEKYKLINIALDYYKVKRIREGDDREVLYRDGILVILGRLMVFDSYLPFIEVSDDYISWFLEGRETSDIKRDKAEIILEFAESYLDELHPVDE